LVEATLACHAAYVTYESMPSGANGRSWQKAVKRLVTILDSTRIALSVYWPRLFDHIHDYAFSETIPSPDEADALTIHNSLRELLTDDTARRLVTEMKLLRSSRLSGPLDADVTLDASPLMASVRCLREVIKELVDIEDVTRFQSEYRMAHGKDIDSQGST